MPLFDKYKNNFICSKDYFDVYIDGKGLSAAFDDYMRDGRFKTANVHINNFSRFNDICEKISKYPNVKVNIILNGERINLVKEPKELIPGFKLLPDNAKISYRKLNENNEVEDKEYASLNPWLTNLSKDDFELVSKKFNKEEQRYVLMQDQIIKHVYEVIKNTNKEFDELDDYEKINIVFDYLNTHIKTIDDISDPIETAINKKGDIESIKELFVILTNNRRMKLKTAYRDKKVIHGLHFYEKFDEFTGKSEIKTL